MVILSYLQRRKLPSLKRRTVKASRVNYMLLKFPFTQAYTMASKQKKFPFCQWHCGTVDLAFPAKCRKNLTASLNGAAQRLLNEGRYPGRTAVRQYHDHYLHWTERGLGRTDKAYLNMCRDDPTNVGWGLFLLSFSMNCNSFQINHQRWGEGWRIGYCCTCCQMAFILNSKC